MSISSVLNPLSLIKIAGIAIIANNRKARVLKISISESMMKNSQRSVSLIEYTFEDVSSLLLRLIVLWLLLVGL
ncbi:hypothetical protein BH18THE2_BH18THE2_34340 [soil metagenome]